MQTRCKSVPCVPRRVHLNHSPCAPSRRPHRPAQGAASGQAALFGEVEGALVASGEDEREARGEVDAHHVSERVSAAKKQRWRRPVVPQG